MSSTLQNLSAYAEQELPSGEGKKFGIVVSQWNAPITQALLNGCRETLLQNQVKEQDLEIIWVPGSFELPSGAKILLGHQAFDAIICLGCVIAGETKHNEYISNAVAQGLTMLSVASGTPCIFGVLTPDTEEQALDRAGGKLGNKGVEAAAAALQMAGIKQRLRKGKTRIGF
ncbi:MAG: 6,7-dimethyl-8-ribityllumazine synthase [Haliscomenobacter sp.]|nr:6,7-dimethyl-8-ribityllumazine synthase [Haliscomenobacter sp.]